MLDWLHDNLYAVCRKNYSRSLIPLENTQIKTSVAIEYWDYDRYYLRGSELYLGTKLATTPDRCVFIFPRMAVAMRETTIGGRSRRFRILLEDLNFLDIVLPPNRFKRVNSHQLSRDEMESESLSDYGVLKFPLNNGN